MREIEAKSLISIKTKCYNVYRGCTHGCIYCDSRSKCYNIEGQFEDIIVKVNAIELVTQELKKKNESTMFVSGSMCDPYMPIEKELKLSRKILEVIYKYNHGVTFLTKNVLALRDLDIMKKINEVTKAIACFTITTTDDELAHIIEPHASSPTERFEALKAFSDAGITTGVWMTPLLPFLTATPSNIRNIVRKSHASGVKYIVAFEMGTTMREGSRDYFYQKLDQFFPGLKEMYQHTYHDNYNCISPNAKKLWEVFVEECDKASIIYDLKKIEELKKIPNNNLFDIND